MLAKADSTDFTMRELAAALGVSHAASYRHFKDRQTLLSAIATEGFVRLGEFQQKGLKEKTEPLARLKHLGVSYVKFALKHPSHFRVMFGPQLADREDLPDLGEVASKTFAPVVGEVMNCQKAGVLDAGTPEPIALALWSSVHGLSMLLIDGQARLSRGNQQIKDSEIIEVVTNATLRGFGATI